MLPDHQNELLGPGRSGTAGETSTCPASQQGTHSPPHRTPPALHTVAAPDCGRCGDTGVIDEVVIPRLDLTAERLEKLTCMFEAAADAVDEGRDSHARNRAGVAQLLTWALSGVPAQGRCSCKRGRSQEVQDRTEQLLGEGANAQEVLLELMPVARALYCMWASHQLDETAPFRPQRQARAAEEAQILLRTTDPWLRDALALSWRRDLQVYAPLVTGGGH
ncbi:hypothetical protein [Streptosporangium sp. NPDC002721]|uniref:hypothetical protein n=1 Tax=Streptosporangium sp. NPDC002721 TaxID=3366188 RepID=UPI0036BF4936